MRKFSTVLGLALVCACTTTAQASAATTKVTDDQLPTKAWAGEPTQPFAHSGWTRFFRGQGTTTITDAAPATQVLGNASLRMSTPAGSSAKTNVFNYDHEGTPLADLTDLGHSTNRDLTSVTSDPRQIPALNLEIDANGPAAGGKATLVFEPLYTPGYTVVPGIWQTWDALGQARWWTPTAGGIPGVCQGSCFVPWDTILAANPDAVISGGLGINQGGGNDGLVASADALRIATAAKSTTYDFDLAGPQAALSGKGTSGRGTTFDFTVTAGPPAGGHARLDLNPDKRYGLREGDVTCFKQVGNRAVFGIRDVAGSVPVFREFLVEDNGSSGDQLVGVGSGNSTAPPATCRHKVTALKGRTIKSGDIALAAQDR